MSVAYIFSVDVLTVVVNGQTFLINKDDHRFAVTVEALVSKVDEDTLMNVLNTPKPTVESYLTDKAQGKATVVYKDGKILVNGVELEGVIVERARAMMDLHLDIDPLLKFIANIEDNPSYNSRNQLYKFLENKHLPITEDGEFFAYKSVTADFKDYHTRSIDNAVGQRVTMDRRLIDDNPNSACSRGLHVGAMEYVENFGYSDKKVILVKVNPANVVSVPSDHSFQKCRVCEYLVVSVCNDVLKSPVCTTTGQEVASQKPQYDPGIWATDEDEDEVVDEYEYGYEVVDGDYEEDDYEDDSDILGDEDNYDGLWSF